MRDRRPVNKSHQMLPSGRDGHSEPNATESASGQRFSLRALLELRVLLAQLAAKIPGQASTHAEPQPGTGVPARSQ